MRVVWIFSTRQRQHEVPVHHIGGSHGARRGKPTRRGHDEGDAGIKIILFCREEESVKGMKIGVGVKVTGGRDGEQL